MGSIRDVAVYNGEIFYFVRALKAIAKLYMAFVIAISLTSLPLLNVVYGYLTNNWTPNWLGCEFRYGSHFGSLVGHI